MLRGFAAVWVMVFHYLLNWNGFYKRALFFVPEGMGKDAVMLFFVISGFVIFMTLGKCRTLADFAYMRFFRIYPAYLASLLLSTALGCEFFGDHFWPGGFLANLTMFNEFMGFPPLDIVYWSLTVELVFYLNVAWVFVLGWHQKPKTMVFAWLTASLVWSFLIFDSKVEARGWPARLFDLDYAPFFTLGIIFYDAAKNGWTRAGIALSFYALAVESSIHGWPGVVRGVVIALIIQAAIRGYLRFLVSRTTLWLGAVSYSLYLAHGNLGYDVFRWLRGNGWRPGMAIPIVMAAALILATALAYGIERPILEKSRRAYAAFKKRNEPVESAQSVKIQMPS